MRFHTAVVHQEGDSAFGLIFPDLPGCFAAADAWEEIPLRAAEAMDLWFDDLADVPPRPLGEVRRLPEVAAALADGATLLTVPYIHPEGVRRIRIGSGGAFPPPNARSASGGQEGAGEHFAGPGAA